MFIDDEDIVSGPRVKFSVLSFF